MPVSTIMVLSMDALSLAVMATIIYALLFENTEETKAARYFLASCVCTFLAIAFDIPSWALENTDGIDTLLYAVNVASLLLPFGTVAFISYYEMEIIGGRERLSRLHARIITALCVVSAALIVIGVFTGDTFWIQDGEFAYGPWYTIAPAVSFVAMIYMDVLAIINRRALGTHDTLAFLAYMVAPVFAVIIETLHSEVSLSLPAAALGSLLLYVMLQSGHVSNLSFRSEILEELTYKDILTGIGNRRAYDRTLDQLGDQRRVNFIFCDVNGLKYVNDQEGHRAGDERLRRFADILRRHFSWDSIYRISGDEFVVIVPDLAPAAFFKRVDTLKEELKKSDDIASAGASTGIGADRKALLAVAEERMYESKEESHLRHPEFKR